MKHSLVVIFICCYCSLLGQLSNFQLNSKIGVSNNIFNNVALTSLEFRPSSYADLNFSTKFINRKKLNLSVGSGLIFTSTQIFQPRIMLGEELTTRIEEEVNLLFGNLSLGVGIQIVNNIYVQFNIKPSVAFIKGQAFSGEFGSLFVVKNYNVFSEVATYFKISESINVGIGYSLGLIDFYKRKYTQTSNNEGGADIFLQSYFIGLQYNLKAN